MNRTSARRALAVATLAAVLAFTVPPPAVAAGWSARAEWGFLTRAWDWFAHGGRPAGAPAGSGLTHVTGKQGAYIDPNGRQLTLAASPHP